MGMSEPTPLTPDDASYEIRVWHPEVPMSTELARWIVTCSALEFMAALNGSVPILGLLQMVDQAKRPDLCPWPLFDRLRVSLAVGLTRVHIRKSDKVEAGTITVKWADRKTEFTAPIRSPHGWQQEGSFAPYVDLTEVSEQPRWPPLTADRE